MSLLSLARAGDASGVAASIAGGADPGDSDPATGKTALHLAAEAGFADVIKALLVSGSGRADPSARNARNGSTPLHGAAYYGQADAARALILAGADPAATNRNGISPLHSAADNGFVGVLRELLREPEGGGTPPDINIRDSKGATPLHYAVAQGHAAAVEFLVHQRRIDVNAADSMNQTPLHWAGKSRQMETCGRLLVEAGADVNATDKGGTSMTMDAASRRTLAGFLKGDMSEATSALANHTDTPRRPEWLDVAPSSASTSETSGAAAPSGGSADADGGATPALLVFPDAPRDTPTKGEKKSSGSSAAKGGRASPAPQGSPSGQVLFNADALSPEEREYAALFSHDFSPALKLNEKPSSSPTRGQDPRKSGRPAAGEKPNSVHSGFIYIRVNNTFRKNQWKIFWFELQPEVQPPNAPEGTLVARIAYYATQQANKPLGMILLPHGSYAGEPMKLKNAALRFAVYVGRKAHMFEVDDGKDKTGWIEAVNGVTEALKPPEKGKRARAPKTKKEKVKPEKAPPKRPKEPKSPKEPKQPKEPRKKPQKQPKESKMSPAPQAKEAAGAAKPSKSAKPAKPEKASKESTPEPDAKPAESDSVPTDSSEASLLSLDFPDVPSSANSSFAVPKGASKSAGGEDSDSGDNEEIERALAGDSVDSDDRREIEGDSFDSDDLSSDSSGDEGISDRRLESLVRGVSYAGADGSDSEEESDDSVDEEEVRRMLQNVDQMVQLAQPELDADLAAAGMQFAELEGATEEFVGALDDINDAFQ
jgi:outer membrane biosynthesis protein TonB